MISKLMRAVLCSCVSVIAVGFQSASATGTADAASDNVILNAATLPYIRTMDDRFQSFQIGMSHLTGGETWKAYSEGDDHSKQAANFEAVRQARAPTDLSNRRLRNLAKGLGPFYVRYGGTTSNSVYFQDDDGPRLDRPPEGFRTILTRKSWAAAVDFAKAIDAKITTGFTVSIGVRDTNGAWTPRHAAPWLAYTQSIGGEIYAAELFNEPNAHEPGWTDEPESAAGFARDFNILSQFVAQAVPNLKLAGPGVARLGVPFPVPSLEKVTAEQYLTASPRPKFDVFSYHFYGAMAERCAPPESPAGISANDALTEAWLARPDATFQAQKALRDAHAPGAPIWLTETGAAACGGTRWQPTFLDSFRFLDTQGRLAKQGLDVIVTHALISGSNGVIDEKTFLPNANYWSALLWRRHMGNRILDAGPITPGLHLYAHCQRGVAGGVTVLAINLDEGSAAINVGGAAELYALTAPELQSRTALLNGQALALDANDQLPTLTAKKLSRGPVTLAPTSINFIAIPKANNPACKI